MVGLGVLSWLVVAALPNVESDREVLLGMAAPLAAAVGTWVMVVRMSSRPQLLTSLMIGAFGAKMVFFGVYVVIMLKVLDVRPLPSSSALPVTSSGCTCLRRSVCSASLRRTRRRLNSRQRDTRTWFRSRRPRPPQKNSTPAR
jgi:hypothetical protein